MEIFFGDNENSLLKEFLKINIVEINNKLYFLERIYNFESYSQEVDFIIKESRVREYHFIICNAAEKFLDDRNLPKIHLNSFKYYYSLESKTYDYLVRSGGQGFDKYKNQLLAYECSLLNLILSIVENYILKKDKKNVTIFECCQAEKSPLELMDEVKKVRNILLRSSIYYPIVRFSVNRNIFKNTLQSYLPDILHFVCHGEPNGDLNFFNGDATGLRRFSPEYFEKIIKMYGSKKIDFIYINSCFSSAFLNKIKINECSKYFINGLGYCDENISLYAKEFAENYYLELSTKGNDCRTTYFTVYSLFPIYKVKLDNSVSSFDYKTRLVFK